MNKITINSFAKVNLSLDVCGTRPDGYHEIETMMQMVGLCDEVTVRFIPYEKRKEMLADNQIPESVDIAVSTSKPYIPCDERNLAYKAAIIMRDRYASGHEGGLIKIDIKKNIPVAAGLAGGSGNAAAVLHALNRMWGLGLDVKALCDLGAPLGADVPFCVMGIAATNLCLGAEINRDPLSATSAIGRGTGTDLSVAPPLEGAFAVLSKPRAHVSTKEVYIGIDAELEAAERNNIHVQHPRASVICHAIETKDDALLAEEMGNLLELYTLKRFPSVARTKSDLRADGNPVKVMMSGSGPTVFAIYRDLETAKKAAKRLKQRNKETYTVKFI